jgi:hypothetical protein
VLKSASEKVNNRRISHFMRIEDNLKKAEITNETAYHRRHRETM